MQFITTVFSSEKQTVENKTFQITTAEQYLTVCCDYHKCNFVETGAKDDLLKDGWLLLENLTLCAECAF